MRIGNVRRLHSGSGLVVSWRMDDPGWFKGRRPAAESFFFAAVDVADRLFDELHEGDKVEFAVVNPEPPRGPRAFAVRRCE